MKQFMQTERFTKNKAILPKTFYTSVQNEQKIAGAGNKSKFHCVTPRHGVAGLDSSAWDRKRRCEEVETQRREEAERPSGWAGQNMRWGQSEVL